MKLSYYLVGECRVIIWLNSHGSIREREEEIAPIYHVSKTIFHLYSASN